MSAKVEVSNKNSRIAVANLVAAIIVAGLILLTGLYLGLTRYYNSHLVDKAHENGQSYTVVMHNEFTGRYSFNIDE